MDIRNKYGTTGLRRVGEKWVSVIFFEGKTRHLGTFNNKELAVQARKSAEIKYRGLNKKQQLFEDRGEIAN